ncbi:MAG: outer membrane lipoprotein-sorting protein [Nitrospinae bacterium]|nr:outer membrane lipoprotein-sorting protein [Nitrospinota bacterium]
MRYFSCLAALFALMATVALAQPADPVARARAILDEIDDLWRGESSRALVAMTVTTAHYTRRLLMEGWSRGKDNSLVVIREPLKERGVATLKTGDSVYSYLPKTDRAIRLTAGMMMGSWMGSHFTNDDLVKESRLSGDYDPIISFEGERAGRRIIEFTLTPRPEAPVVWGKIVIEAYADTKLPIVSVYYDEDGKVARTMTFSKIHKIGGRLMPGLMRVVPADKPEESTELEYREIEFDLPLGEEFFSLSNLKRG